MPPRTRRRESSLTIDNVASFGRNQFLAERWDCRPGEHVTVLGPTGCGKTTWLNELAMVTAKPSFPFVVLATKPRDSTVDELIDETGWKKTAVWPPNQLPTPVRRLLGIDRPPGWILWPRFTFDPELDEANMAVQFRAAYQQLYRKGRAAIVCDEMDSVGSLRAGPKQSPVSVYQINALKRGRSMGLSCFQASQRPFGLPQEAYSQATHLFLFYDPDDRNVDRFAEFGGVDPIVVKRLVEQLPDHGMLYLRRRGRKICVVQPD